VSQKGCNQTHGSNFVKSQSIFKIILQLEREEKEISNKTHVLFPTTPEICSLWEFKSLNLSQIWKKMQTKNVT